MLMCYKCFTIQSESELKPYRHTKKSILPPENHLKRCKNCKCTVFLEAVQVCEITNCGEIEIDGG